MSCARESPPSAGRGRLTHVLRPARAAHTARCRASSWRANTVPAHSAAPTRKTYTLGLPQPGTASNVPSVHRRSARDKRRQRHPARHRPPSHVEPHVSGVPTAVLGGTTDARRPLSRRADSGWPARPPRAAGGPGSPRVGPIVTRELPLNIVPLLVRPRGGRPVCSFVAATRAAPPVACGCWRHGGSVLASSHRHALSDPNGGPMTSSGASSHAFGPRGPAALSPPRTGPGSRSPADWRGRVRARRRRTASGRSSSPPTAPSWRAGTRGSWTRTTTPRKAR